MNEYIIACIPVMFIVSTTIILVMINECGEEIIREIKKYRNNKGD